VVIDFHTHIVPEHLPSMANRVGGDRWPVMQCTDPAHKHIVISGKNFRTVSHQCWSVPQRLEDMVSDQVFGQVLSPMPELLSYWFEAKDTLEFSRYMNEQIAGMVQQKPDRLFGLGMLPLQDPALAASEIPRLKREFGLSGVEVGTNVNGRMIGDPFFEPFFEAAEAEDIVVFVHPLHPLGRDRIVGEPALEVAVAFPSETAFAITSLISGGLLDKYPKLKLVFSHGGGGFALMLPRLVQGWHTVPQIQKSIMKNPREYAQMLFYDTLVYDLNTLKYLIDSFGSSQLVVGSDYPFSIMQTNVGNVLDSLMLSVKEKEAIAFRNALHLLGKL
jgi:aminocarboxymuconate-semialdehyde decarboxylase